MDKLRLREEKWLAQGHTTKARISTQVFEGPQLYSFHTMSGCPLQQWNQSQHPHHFPCCSWDSLLLQTETWQWTRTSAQGCQAPEGKWENLVTRLGVAQYLCCHSDVGSSIDINKSSIFLKEKKSTSPLKASTFIEKCISVFGKWVG